MWADRKGARHWVVLCSSLILVIIFYGVTPIMSALVSKKIVTRTLAFPVERAGIYTPEAQAAALTTTFSYIAFSNFYLNGSLPPFTTKDFAVLPFAPMKNRSASATAGAGQDEVWCGNTTLYEARLDCRLGSYRRERGTLELLTFPERNCRLMFKFGSGGEYSPYYSSVVSNISVSGVDFNYAETDCAGPGNVDMLVALFVRNAYPDARDSDDQPLLRNSTAIHCRPVHEQQQVEVVVNAHDLSIKNWTRKGDKRAFTGLNLRHWMPLVSGYRDTPTPFAFNLPETGPVISRWDMPDHISQLIRKPQFQTLIDLYPVPNIQTLPGIGFTGNRTQPINVYFQQRSSLTPFGLANVQDLEALFDADGRALMAVYNDAYRYLFAMAMVPGYTGYASERAGTLGELVPATNLANQTSVLREFKQDGYVVDELWTRALQGTLCTVLVLAVALACLVWNRGCELVREPGTIADAIASLDADGSVAEEFQDSEFLRPSQLEQVLCARGHRYSLRGQKLSARRLADATYHRHHDAEPAVNRDQISLSKSWELSLVLGGVAVVLLVCWMILLIVLFIRAREGNGFAVPAGAFVYDLYAAYVPTVAATFFESFLVLLTSQFTLIFPFKHLKRGNASAKISIDVNYDRRPPHLQVANALRLRNPLLAVLSGSILLANAFAVALGGLFFKSTVGFEEPISGIGLVGSLEALEAYNATAGSLIRGEYDIPYDSFYVATGEAIGFQRRPWTTDELFYIPFSVPADQRGHSDANYTVETFGLGMAVKCEEIPSTAILTWNAIDPEYNKTDFAGKHRWFSFTTLRGASAVEEPLVARRTADGTISGPLGEDPRKDHIGWFFTPELTDGTEKYRYFEQAPVPYPVSLGGKTDWEFFASWHRYAYDPDRSVTINRAFFPQNVTQGYDFLDSDVQYLNRTVSGPAMYIDSRVGIRCNTVPRLVRSTVVANLAGDILSHRDMELQLVAQAIAAANRTNMGITAIVNTFTRNVVLRVARLQGAMQVLTIGPSRSYVAEPTNWLTQLVYSEGRKRNATFDLYTSSPAQSARVLESVYQRTFAIYLQLNADEIFSQAPSSSSSSSAQSAAAAGLQGTIIHGRERVLMHPVAFYVAIAMLLVFIPAVAWTYISLYNGFLAHQPTTLAGIYAAVYATDVSPATSAAAKRVAGVRYGYGWFVGRDGRRHVGVGTEPLMGGPGGSADLLGS